MRNHEAPPTSHRGDPLAELGASMATSSYARRGVGVSDETIRVMLVDDHEMVREGLRVLLRGAPDIAVVGEAASGVAIVEQALRLQPHVIVLDVDMPLRDGLSTLRDLSAELPKVHVLMLTMYPEHDHLLQVLEAGARGYLTKEAASKDLEDAIRVVASGEVYVRPTAARLLAAAVVPERASRSASGRFNLLSTREQTILRMVAQGYSGAEISRKLNISTKTVAAYKQRIEEKLGLQHRTDYVRFAIEAHILTS